MLAKYLIGVFIFTCTLVFGCGAVILLNPANDNINQISLPEQNRFPVAFIEEEASLDEELMSVQDISNRSFNGWYEHEADKKMPEVNLISLTLEIDPETGKINKEYSGAAVFTSFEMHSDQGVVGDKWTKFDLPNVEFRTKKINGFDYRFKGVFFEEKTVGETGEKLLRGKLQKFRNGKKVAEVTGDFSYSEPHCWH